MNNHTGMRSVFLMWRIKSSQVSVMNFMLWIFIRSLRAASVLSFAGTHRPAKVWISLWFARQCSLYQDDVALPVMWRLHRAQRGEVYYPVELFFGCRIRSQGLSSPAPQ